MKELSKILKHLLSTLSHMFRRVATAFAGVFVASFLIVEGSAAFLTKQFPPATLTHVVAILFGFSFGLVVSLLIAIEEGIRGLITIVEEVAVEAEHVASTVLKDVEKGASTLVKGIEHGGETVGHETGHILQSIGGGAGNLLKEAEKLPERALGAVEGTVSGIERKFTGQHDEGQQ